jgi:hypothetical protein
VHRRKTTQHAAGLHTGERVWTQPEIPVVERSSRLDLARRERMSGCSRHWRSTQVRGLQVADLVALGGASREEEQRRGGALQLGL